MFKPPLDRFLTLDSLRADAAFGWRQLLKRKATSAAAIVSLALAIGACTSAFRIIDALLLRPLPVTSPERLHALIHRGIDFDGEFESNDSWLYPMIRQMRDAVRDKAELIAVSHAERTELAYASNRETEKACLQYVSGWMFRDFGVRPALGRVLTDNDDLKPGAHPVAVLSFDYFMRRFQRDPAVIGHTLRVGSVVYTIIGVAGQEFTGVEPGTITDIFVPTMMNPNVQRSDFYWVRTLVHLKQDNTLSPVVGRLQAVYRSFQQEQLKTLTGLPQRTLAGIANQQVTTEPAAAGVSDMQQEYRTALAVLGVLAFLVLLIACANVANLMSAQAATRAREMALRISIGAGRFRLIQLVLIESAILASLASALGAAIAWWAAPFVVSRINPPDNPARLVLPADWRVLCFLILLSSTVALLFGLAPALRASDIKPAIALKGGEEPHSQGRLMRLLIAAQIAFSCFVLFVAGLFLTTLSRLSHQPTGFSAERLLTIETDAERPQQPAFWNQVAAQLSHLPGVQSIALADWPLLSENVRGGYISVAGNRPFPDPAFFLKVSPGWLNTMQIPLANGRDFHAADVFPKVAIVNEAFAARFFHAQNPVGRTFVTALEDESIRLQVVGVARNARYADVRGPMPPVVYFPFRYVDAKGALLPRSAGTFVVRTSTANPDALAPELRRQLARRAPQLRVSNLRTQQQINAVHTIRERLVALLGLFFACVAVLLSGIGIYGVLDYSVFQRRREIGIRMAIGAQAADIARQILLAVFAMATVGAILGLGLGIASAEYLQTLIYQVGATEPSVLILPLVIILGSATVAALPALFHALNTDPATVLRD